jgi:hypothetical protein
MECYTSLIHCDRVLYVNLIASTQLTLATQIFIREKEELSILPLEVQLVFGLFLIWIIHLIDEGENTHSKHNVDKEIISPRYRCQARCLNTKYS